MTMYVSTDDVYSIAGITSSEVSESTVTASILEAESVVDKITNSTFYTLEENGTASEGTDSTLVDDTKDWTADAFIGEYIWIYSGTGSGQIRYISDNTTDTITVDEDWTTNPDDTSKYRICHTGSNPNINDVFDGTGERWFILDKTPLVLLEELTIDGTDITTSNVYQYKGSGKLILKQDAEKTKFEDAYPQLIGLNYYFGTYPIPYYIKRLCGVYAALFILQTQMGGTHNIPSTYSLPEGSVSIGQAYVNIRGTWDVLMKEKERLEQEIYKEPFLA